MLVAFETLMNHCDLSAFVTCELTVVVNLWGLVSKSFEL